jgi:hypothetical protein
LHKLFDCLVVRFVLPEPRLLADGRSFNATFDSETGCLLSKTGQRFDPAVWLEDVANLTVHQRDQQLIELDYYIRKLRWSEVRPLPVYSGTIGDVLKSIAALEPVRTCQILAPRIAAIVSQLERSNSPADRAPAAETQVEQYLSLLFGMFLSVFAAGERPSGVSWANLLDDAIALAGCRLWALLHLVVPRFDHLFRQVISSCFSRAHAYQYKTVNALAVVTWEALGRRATITLLAVQKATGRNFGVATTIIRSAPSVLAGATVAEMLPAAKRFAVSPLSFYVTKSLLESKVASANSLQAKK